MTENAKLRQLQEWLHTMPYRDYLQTEYWRQRRLRALHDAGLRCQVCNSEGPLDVHHRTYERRGWEWPSDLTVLCRQCHRDFSRRRVLAPPPMDGPSRPRPSWVEAPQLDSPELRTTIKAAVDEAVKDHRRQQVAELFEPIPTKTFEKVGRSLPKLRQYFPKAYVKWTEREEATLEREFKEGWTLDDIAEWHGRTPAAIEIRLITMGLLEKPDEAF